MKAVALIACGCVLGACAVRSASVVERDATTATTSQAADRPDRLDVLVRDREDRPVSDARVGEIQSDSRRFWAVPVPAGPVPGTWRLDGHVPGAIRLYVRAHGF